ncbi:MAG: RNase adapter RapZ [Hydrogenophilales bacterium CG17_big_fil_post_rev_8_21_14_2_50_63_12]|nr:MAG: RNase adapter RapZ [Hydrogenophilales bacterium CG17_big_fil_post_rev_8_21_14_2_50_63_12]
MRVVVVSGLSGSGKSVALKAMEDANFYCVDNLPAALLPEAVEYLRLLGIQDAALSIDSRSGGSLVGLPDELERLRGKVDLRVIFLTAKDDTLVKRFSETRRRHPLNTGERSLEECIRQEREMLARISANAHLMDTSDLSANTLRDWIKDFLGLHSAGFTLVFESFGFKHGIPMDADLVFDVRCLPNPHYDPTLKPLTGRDAPVIAFLQAQEPVADMLKDIRAFVAKWLPSYIKDNRSYFTVGLGCTGGQHRSVYFAEALADAFRESQQVLIRHRELS